MRVRFGKNALSFWLFGIMFMDGNTNTYGSRWELEFNFGPLGYVQVVRMS